MNKAYFLSACVILAFSACRIPYEPDIETDQQILVVDGFISDLPNSCYVRLSLAIPYDSSGSNPPVQNAIVQITDLYQNIISFQEIKPGYYTPEESDYAGEVGSTYILTVTTPAGITYVSNPQTILPSVEPDRVYGGFNRIKYLMEDYSGKTIMVSKLVCATYFDYTGNGVTPHYRYTSSQLAEYSIHDFPNTFNCWRTQTDNGLRFTNQNFASTTVDIIKQEVCFSPPTRDMKVFEIVENPNPTSPERWVVSTESVIELLEFRRILTISQYRLNDESYKYYKAVNNQSNAEGKIFDPIISQLKGNITCTSDPSKLVFGFFEASGKTTFSFILTRSGLAGNIIYTPIDNLPPHPENGFMVNDFPDFWIQ